MSHLRRILLLLALPLLASLGTAAQTPPSYQGLWWNSPAASENGWGLNLTHQGDILFGTWFTYDTDGRGMWLVMPRLDLMPNDYGDGYGYYMPGMTTSYTYAGPLFRPTGSPYDSATFDSNATKLEPVGSATIVFRDANNGDFAFSVGNVLRSKSITRLVYGPMPTCTFDASGPPTTNYQDLWWRSPPGSESGWGVNLAHQGDILFATWFTYDAAGRAAWFLMSNGNRTGPATYSGGLYRTTGPSFSALPWTGTAKLEDMGTATFAFTDANNGTFTTVIAGVTQAKPITRLVFAAPSTTCR